MCSILQVIYCNVQHNRLVYIQIFQGVNHCLPGSWKAEKRGKIMGHATPLWQTVATHSQEKIIFISASQQTES